MSVAAPAGLGDFSAVDADPSTAADLVAALDEQASLPAIQRLRASAFELLGARLGHRLLEAGCGTGDVTRALAGIVGRDGFVVGVEASSVMLREARRRLGAGNLPVELRSGDVNDLDDPDGSFDGVMCERVFQHLDRPDLAIAELVRVTRSGGRICVVDTDWGMHAVHGADPALTAKIVDAWRANAANGLAGRRLPSLFAGASVRDTTVIAATITSTDPRRPTLPPFTTMATVAERSGAVAAGAGATWLAQLVDAGRRGEFFWAVTMFAVGGTRP
jgi:ubiquinone/menaquinone biosynthesis C-methylase UbiE